MKTIKKSNPIVLANTEWMPPDWLLEEVKHERMIISLLEMAKPNHFKNDADYIGDAECLAYLMPATFIAPLDSDNSQIYLYLASRVIEKNKKAKIPNDIKVEKLTDYQMELLNKLKTWLFKQRNGKIRNPVLEAFQEVFSQETKQLKLI